MTSFLTITLFTYLPQNHVNPGKLAFLQRAQLFFPWQQMGDFGASPPPVFFASLRKEEKSLAVLCKFFDLSLTSTTVRLPDPSRSPLGWCLPKLFVGYVIRFTLNNCQVHFHIFCYNGNFVDGKIGFPFSWLLYFDHLNFRHFLGPSFFRALSLLFFASAHLNNRFNQFHVSLIGGEMCFQEQLFIPRLVIPGLRNFIAD